MVNEPDLVDNILARLLQRVAEVMKRVGIVGLLTRDDDLACAFVAVGHLGDVANQIDKVALLCRGIDTAALYRDSLALASDEVNRANAVLR